MSYCCYIQLDALTSEQTVSVEYPLMWKKTEETVAKQMYRLFWKGDTVIEISPRGERYPIFQREHMRGNEALLIEREYATPSKQIHW